VKWVTSLSDIAGVTFVSPGQPEKDVERSWAFASALPGYCQRGTILNMSEEATALLKKALTLPEKERAELASSLIDSLDSAIDEGVEAAWQGEIARRIEALRSGRAKTVPWEEVRKKARVILQSTNRRSLDSD
jgi:putative addiction module component (TIGR02574 family)